MKAMTKRILCILFAALILSSCGTGSAKTEDNSQNEQTETALSTETTVETEAETNRRIPSRQEKPSPTICRTQTWTATRIGCSIGRATTM